MGRGYYERKRLEGKTPKVAMRCLKRRLSDVVYWQLVADRRNNHPVRISYNPDADAAYIHLGDDPGAAHRTTTQAATPDGVDGFVALDWDDGRIVGIETLDASSRLTQDILDEAEHAN